MKPITQNRNAIVRWSLIVIIVVDMVLIGVNWDLSRSPHVQAGDLRRLDILEKSYRADDTRLERFRRELPADDLQRSLGRGLLLKGAARHGGIGGRNAFFHKRPRFAP